MQDIAVPVAEAPWNNLAAEEGYDAAEPQRLGLGCSALPSYEYQEASAEAPPQSSSRPMYDRCASSKAIEADLLSQAKKHLSAGTAVMGGDACGKVAS